MPRPPIELTPDQVREVETLAALLNQDQIADYFGIARNTFRAICGRDEEVLARYKRGKAKAIAHVANGLLQKARAGDTVSSIFYLKTQAGWRETTQLEHSGPDGQPIAVTGARERLAAMLDDLHDRMQLAGAADVTIEREAG
jgi:DNA-binding CsgD family transcriptional regulator